MWGRFWLRILGWGLLGAAVLALLVYPLDFAVWRIRVARGGGMGSVATYDLVAAEEKGNKEEYFANGADSTPCSRSLYPQEGHLPCWWLERHPDHVVRY